MTCLVWHNMDTQPLAGVSKFLEILRVVEIPHWLILAVAPQHLDQRSRNCSQVWSKIIELSAVFTFDLSANSWRKSIKV